MGSLDEAAAGLSALIRDLRVSRAGLAAARHRLVEQRDAFRRRLGPTRHPDVLRGRGGYDVRDPEHRRGGTAYQRWSPPSPNPTRLRTWLRPGETPTRLHPATDLSAIL